MKGLTQEGYAALEAELIAETIEAGISSIIAEELIAEIEAINAQASEESLEAYRRWRRTSEWIEANGEDRGVWPGRTR